MMCMKSLFVGWERDQECVSPYSCNCCLNLNNEFKLIQHVLNNFVTNAGLVKWTRILGLTRRFKPVPDGLTHFFLNTIYKCKIKTYNIFQKVQKIQKKKTNLDSKVVALEIDTKPMNKCIDKFINKLSAVTTKAQDK